MWRGALALVFVCTFATWLFRRASEVRGTGLDGVLFLGFGLALLALAGSGACKRDRSGL